MPIDLFSVFNKGTSYVANDTMAGNVISNPISLTILILFAIVLILYAHNRKKMVKFKILFYMSIIILSALVLHDILLRERLKEKYAVGSGVDMVMGGRNTFGTSQIKPRVREDLSPDDPDASYYIEDIKRSVEASDDIEERLDNHINSLKYL
jgi:hypothetical protein